MHMICSHLLSHVFLGLLTLAMPFPITSHGSWNHFVNHKDQYVKLKRKDLSESLCHSVYFLSVPLDRPWNCWSSGLPISWYTDSNYLYMYFIYNVFSSLWCISLYSLSGLLGSCSSRQEELWEQCMMLNVHQSTILRDWVVSSTSAWMIVCQVSVLKRKKIMIRNDKSA